jgi:hypothetical protein
MAFKLFIGVQGKMKFGHSIEKIASVPEQLLSQKLRVRATVPQKKLFSENLGGWECTVKYPFQTAIARSPLTVPTMIDVIKVKLMNSIVHI